MYQRDSDESIRFGFIQTLQQAAASHAGIDQYTHSSSAKNGKYKGDEFNGWPDHQDQSMAGPDSEADQPASHAIDVCVQLCE
jgi:hypothetical protein